MQTLVLTLRPTFKVPAAVFGGLAIAGLLLLAMGIGKQNARLFNIPVGEQTQPAPSANWSRMLTDEVAAHGVTDWKVQSFTDSLTYNSDRRSWYRATIEGTRDGEAVIADVALVAEDGGKWTLHKWSER